MTLISLEDALTQLDADNSWRRFQVGYEPRASEHWRIRSFTIEPRDIFRCKIVATEGMNRDPGSGTFTKIEQRLANGGWQLWMSDTRAEILEHYPLFNALWWGDRPKARQRVLINGLGLGMAVHGALTYPSVEHIDVVELSPDLAEFMRPCFPEDKVTIHVGNALEMKWPPRTTWDVAWHDIWPHIDEDNLPEMHRLHRMYGRRVAWQDSWQRKGCERLRNPRYQAKHDNAEEAFTAALLGFPDLASFKDKLAEAIQHAQSEEASV